MALYYLPQYKQTTLSVAGGIDSSQTTGIILTNVDDVDIAKPGVVCVNWADPLDTDTCEFITYTSIDGSNELQGVTRGAEGITAKAHNNSVAVAWPVSKSNINNINDLLTGVTAGIKVKTAIYDTSGNEVIKTPATASAVNEVTVTNAATENDPALSATGGDTNIDLDIKGKGTGGVGLGTGTVKVTDVVDQDDMSDDSATKLATQQSIKAYVDSGTVTMTNKTLTSPVLNTGVSGTAVLDEDDMASDSNTKVATQQSIKKYVDDNVSSGLSSKMLTATRDMAAASGDVAYTGVGFQPTSIICLAFVNADSLGSWGFADSAKLHGYFGKILSGVFYAAGSLLCFIEKGTTNHSQAATVKSYDADGFTLTWTRTNTPTGTIELRFLCFR